MTPSSNKRHLPLRMAAAAKVARSAQAPSPRPPPAASTAQASELARQNDDLRRAQIAAEASRDRYRDLYEFAPVGYLTLTTEGLVAQLNLTAAKLLGRPRRALQGKSLALLVADYDQDRWQRFLASVRENEAQDSVEVDLTRGDGTVFYAQLDCLRMSDRSTGAELRVALIDVSARKQAESALFDSHETLCSILATTKDGFWQVDSQGTLVDVNAVYVQQSGYSRGELLGMRIGELETADSAVETA